MYAEAASNVDDQPANAPRRHSGARRPQQTPLARRRRLNKIARQLGSEAGISKPNAAERAALAQVATLVLRAADLETAIVRGEPVDNGEMVRVASELRRMLGRLRKRPDAKPQSLREYLAERAAQKPADASGEPGA